MTNRRIEFLWFVAASLFFVVAMLKDESRAVYIALGVVFLALGAGSNLKKKG
ncbi:MAG TPA: hypothetical protein VJ715_14825 [Pyrinomonadaceae bacterium]|nr:hypothetical protein [Pyrinomonadaceae bacterium]